MELWHALNRGVEGRNLFVDTQDYARFVHNLYEFNDVAPADNLWRLFDSSGMRDFVNPSFRQARKLLVDIHGWVLMKDHYHLLLSERVAGGISLFLRKLNIGYANYFNERYTRKGTLFQGRTKKILIEREAHFLYILHYLHLNPLDYLQGAQKWRFRSKSGIQSEEEALNYLDAYRWSSYLDYVDKKNFPSILTTSLFKNSFNNYSDSLNEFLRDSEYESDDTTKLILE
ncbi:MAG: transposase [bacterium]|nr:transposase [bacterium]